MPQKVAGNFHHQYDVTSTNCITKPYYQHRNHESQCGQQRILRGQWSLRRRRMTISYFSTASNSCVPVSALQMRAAVLPFRGLIDQSPAPPHLLGRRSPASTYFVGTYNHKRRKAPTAAAAAAEGDPDLPRGPLSSSLLQVQRHIIHAPHALLVSCPLMRHILPSPDQPARRMCMAPAAPHASINTCRLMALGITVSAPCDPPRPTIRPFRAPTYRDPHGLRGPSFRCLSVAPLHPSHSHHLPPRRSLQRLARPLLGMAPGVGGPLPRCLAMRSCGRSRALGVSSGAMPDSPRRVSAIACWPAGKCPTPSPSFLACWPSGKCPIPSPSFLACWPAGKCRTPPPLLPRPSSSLPYAAYLPHLWLRCCLIWLAACVR